MSQPSLDAYLVENRQRYLDELFALLRIPSVSSKPSHNDQTRQCAEFVAERLRGAGLENVTVHETPQHPIVTADWLHAGPDAPTLLVYGHYDVQPPEPLDLWTTPPFEPTVRDGRIYARGASDDKGQMYAHIKGVEAHLATANRLPVNVKFLIEGEEEVGSTNLAPFLTKHREMLAGDAVIISDTAMAGPGQPAITYALRGLTYLQIEVEGPGRDLHSGMYGGGVQNPIQALCTMIASLKDDQGRITIPGIYDAVRPISDDERQKLAQVPFDDAAWLADTGASEPFGETGYTTLERMWARPSLDVCGIWGGYTGEGAKTVLPSKAYAKISMRIVPDQTPEAVTELLCAHLQSLAPPGTRVSIDPMHGGQAAITDVSHPAVKAAVRAFERAYDTAPCFMRAGGSIPIVADFQRILNQQSVLMGLGLNDDCIHSPNEKFDVECYYKGIAASAYLWEELARS